MDNKKEKFITTNKLETKEKLEKLGCRLLFQTDNSWIFINDLEEIPINFCEEHHNLNFTNTLTF